MTRSKQLVTVLIGFLALLIALPAQTGTAAAAAQVCRNGVCDGQKDPGTALEDKVLQPTFLFGRRIDLHVSYRDGGMVWASIDNGGGGDEAWLDRTFDNGATWDGPLGRTSIPAGGRGWRTQMFWINDPARGTGLVRACGKAGDRAEIACTHWLPVCTAGWCDGADPAAAGQDRVVQPAGVHGRRVELHLDYADGGGMAWASTDNGDPGDEVWIDRTFNGGASWHSRLVTTAVPGGQRGWRTWMVPLGGGKVRACGKAGNRPEISCTAWLPNCGSVCDGADPAGVAERAVNPTSWVFWRRVTLHISSDSRSVWASIGRASPGDEVWIDRSPNGGGSWDGKLGDTFVPAGQSAWRTWRYSFDGSVRACGKAGDRSDVACTPWVRPSDGFFDMHREAVNLLRAAHNPQTQMWGPDGGIWLSANALTALIEYEIRTGDRSHMGVISSVFNWFAPGGGLPDHNGIRDDYGWWALAWMRAYDLTGDGTYLDIAEDIADEISQGWSTVCGGGIEWTTQTREKNTITNTLFLKLTAGLHNRGRGGGRWLQWANDTWSWFRNGGGRLLVGDSPGLAKDTVHEVNGQCAVKLPTATYTYMQGTLAAGLTELHRATGISSYLDWATGVANAVTTQLVEPSGVLDYAAERDSLGMKEDGTRHPTDDAAFKGACVRNLREVYDYAKNLGRPTGSWRTFFLRQPQAMVAEGRSGWAEFGVHWRGPLKHSSYVTFASQLTAVDAFNSAHGL